MNFLHGCEYGTLKPVEVILMRDGGIEGIMEGMTQTRVHCVYRNLTSKPPIQLLYISKQV
jgi:hypothetical protein